MPCSIIKRALLVGAALPLLAFAADITLRVNDPYVRLAPPSAPASAAFMVITNSGRTDRQLVKALSPVAKTVELHSHVNENGVMKMREVPSIEIKANGQVELKPGSFHIMLIDVKAALNDGDEVPITLSFDDGSTLQIKAPVRKMQASAPAAQSMEHQAMKH